MIGQLIARVPIAGWEASYVVAQIDRDGRIVVAMSRVFTSREEAERVWRWKRRGRPGVAVVQLFLQARVLT